MEEQDINSKISCAYVFMAFWIIGAVITFLIVINVLPNPNKTYTGKSDLEFPIYSGQQLVVPVDSSVKLLSHSPFTLSYGANKLIAKRVESDKPQVAAEVVYMVDTTNLSPGTWKMSVSWTKYVDQTVWVYVTAPKEVTYLVNATDGESIAAGMPGAAVVFIGFFGILFCMAFIDDAEDEIRRNKYEAQKKVSAESAETSSEEFSEVELPGFDEFESGQTNWPLPKGYESKPEYEQQTFDW